MPELEPRRPPPFQDSNRSRSFAGIEQRLSPAAVVNTISRSPARSVAIEPVANVAVARLLLTVRGRFSGRPSAPTVYMIPVRSSHVTSSVMIVCGSTTEAGSAFDRRTSRSIGAGNGIPPPQSREGGFSGSTKMWTEEFRRSSERFATPNAVFDRLASAASAIRPATAPTPFRAP